MQVRKQIGAYDPLDGLPDKELLCLGVVSDMVAGSKGTEARGCSFAHVWCDLMPLCPPPHSLPPPPQMIYLASTSISTSTWRLHPTDETVITVEMPYLRSAV